MPHRVLSACLVLSALASSGASAQTAANLLLVLNKDSAGSVQVAEHYARVRGVPQDQVLRLSLGAPADDLERVDFEARIQAPVADWIRRHGAQDRLLFIVLAKGVPLRIRGTSGRSGTVASVDSELALLYRRMAGDAPPLAGPLPNPYFLGDAPVERARPFTHREADIYLVTRLDGYTVDDVLKVIDRGAAPMREGRILLDQRGAREVAGGNTWLRRAADWLTSHGFGDRVVLDTTAAALAGGRPAWAQGGAGPPDRSDAQRGSGVIGYYSWGSNDPAITSRALGLAFVPGALAGMFVSTDARTFREPPPGWMTGPWGDQGRYWAGSPQSLTGDLIRDGVTGAAGHVAEPFLDATIRPDILFPAYVSGFNLAESFYLAMPYVSWQTVVVGDPLCAPFPRKGLQPADIDPGPDPATETAAFFSARALRAAAARGIGPEAARLLLRADARRARGDEAGARAALEQATAVDPKLAGAQVQLAIDDEARKDYARAAERYRLALDVVPDDPAALNNLAYILATRLGKPAEALGYAERAVAGAPESATVADTLAWTRHLLGRDEEAARAMPAVVAALPRNAEVRLHAAVIYAAVGRLDAAAAELAEALRLQPSLAGTDEAEQVRKATGRKEDVDRSAPGPRA
jgi:uncharacterized protein (TIGR03790 family)